MACGGKHTSPRWSRSERKSVAVISQGGPADIRHHRRRRGTSPALIDGRRGHSPALAEGRRSYNPPFGEPSRPRHSLPGIGAPSRARIAPGPRPSLPAEVSGRPLLARTGRVVSGASGSSKSEEAGSVASEPAYTRLRGELAAPSPGRPRGRSASDEDRQSKMRSRSGDKQRRGNLDTPMSELVRALREAKRN